MSDILTNEQRHECMSHIRSKNTKPEVRLRRELFMRGYRYRVNVKRMPGTPDIAMAKYRTCIFVNGCFWHGHEGCPKFVIPATNTEFWSTKIANNRERDLRDYAFLESRGWRVIVVWECELTATNIANTVCVIQKQLESNRESWLKEMEERKIKREEWKAEIRRRKEESERVLSDLKSMIDK